MDTRLDFSGKSIIVTGGSRGIGRAAVKAFLSRGARVYATFNAQKKAAEEASNEFRDLPGTLSMHQVDVSSEPSVRAFFDDLEDLDVLVNNAGITSDAPVSAMSLEQFEQVVRVNLTGTFLMSRYAIELLAAKDEGSIINVTSPSGEIGLPGQANYAASKAGITALTKVLARELGGLGIRANCVSPGFTDTDMISSLPPETREAYMKQIALRRFAEPSEVADMIVFLASPAAAYVTGETFRITGGM